MNAVEIANGGRPKGSLRQRRIRSRPSPTVPSKPILANTGEEQDQ